MPIDYFHENTFVAFLDIWAFRSLMTKNKAITALNSLYNYGYKALSTFNGVDGIFISDSGILFVRNRGLDGLINLLKVVKEINKRMVKDGFILTTSIAFGEFRYERRYEHMHIQKIPIYGYGYVSAWFDNERGSPKIKPGQCRIFTKNIVTEDIREQEINTFPREVEEYLNQKCLQNDILKLIRKYDEDCKHYREV